MALLRLRGRFFVAVALMAAMALLAVINTPAVWDAATLIMAVVAAAEWGRLCGYGALDRLLYAGLFAAFALVASLLGDAQTQLTCFVIVSVFWAFVAPLCLLKRWGISPLLMATLGMMLIYAVWKAASLLYQHDITLLYASMILIWLFDIASYFVGRALGSIRLAPAVSPKKTVEGAFGGLIAVLIGSLLYRAFYAEEAVPWVVVLSLSLTLAILCLVGDLFISLLKRHAGSKDSGKVLGDHGGVLDRVDSMLSVAPVAALLSPWIV